jgi:hypothetical protein
VSYVVVTDGPLSEVDAFKVLGSVRCALADAIYVHSRSEKKTETLKDRDGPRVRPVRSAAIVIPMDAQMVLADA